MCYFYPLDISYTRRKKKNQPNQKTNPNQLVNQQTLVSIESKNFLYQILKDTNYTFLWFKCTNLDFFLAFSMKKPLNS